MNPEDQHHHHSGKSAGDAAAIVLIALAARAGQNHLKQNNDLKQSFNVGVEALFKMFGWVAMFGMWIFSILWVLFWWAVMASGAPDEPFQLKLVFMVLGIPALFVVSPLFGVMWCRIGDFCLFHRGWFYKFWQPLARRMENVSNAKIHLVLVGMMFLLDVFITYAP